MEKNIDKLLIEYVKTVLENGCKHRVGWALGAINFALRSDLVDFETWCRLDKEIWNAYQSEINGKGVLE